MPLILAFRLPAQPAYYLFLVVQALLVWWYWEALLTGWGISGFSLLALFCCQPLYSGWYQPVIYGCFTFLRLSLVLPMAVPHAQSRRWSPSFSDWARMV